MGAPPEVNLIMKKMKAHTFLGKDDNDYKRLNLTRGIPEAWEDGMRTTGGKGTYEWWYFDAHLEDGSKIVIVFYTKAMTDVNKPLNAYATLNIDYSDGTKIERYLPSAVFRSATDQCDVNIGKNYFRGDLKSYKIHLEDHDFQLDIEFHNESESWRSETGHIYFGQKGDFFAWLVPVPKGTSKVTYTFQDRTISTEGICYHDHNWGNKMMHKLINHWYWSRSEFGPYTIIACQIIPEKKYGHDPVYLINILKDGKKILDNPSHLILYKSYPVIADLGHKPISDHMILRYEEGTLRFDIELNRQKNIMETYLIQQEFKRKMAKRLIGFNGAYFRIAGKARLNIFENNQLNQSFENDHSIWELMFFGNPL